MPNQSSLEQIELAELTQSVDDGRVAADSATFDAAALSLSVSALPDHATTLRAFRHAAGGTAELVGTSVTTTVSLTDLGPLTHGVTYEFWLVGHNSRCDVPESNHVTHVAT